MKKYNEPFPLFIIENFFDIRKISIPNLNKKSRDGCLFYDQTNEINVELDIKIKKFLYKTLLPLVVRFQKKFFFEIPNQLDYSAVFMNANSGYKLLPHNDSRDRLFSGMLYLDCFELISGGELIFFNCENKINLPHLMEENNEILITIKPKPGSFVCWLNSYNSYHGVSELKGKRQSIYISLSSNEKIWKTD